VRALIIQNDARLAEKLAKSLLDVLIDAEEMSLSSEGTSTIRHGRYDLIFYCLVDRNTEGLKSLEKVRGEMITPVIAVVIGASPEEKILWFENGADDFFDENTSYTEIQVRAQAIIRRHNGHAGSIINVGKLQIDLAARTVKVSGIVIYLTKMQFRTLEALALSTPKTLTNDYLVKYFCNDGNPPTVNTIQQAVSGIRKKLKLACDGSEYLHPSFAGGYALFDGGSHLNEDQKSL
jgi:two-component system cell cycle response regulator CtrA